MSRGYRKQIEVCSYAQRNDLQLPTLYKFRGYRCTPLTRPDAPGGASLQRKQEVFSRSGNFPLSTVNCQLELIVHCPLSIKKILPWIAPRQDHVMQFGRITSLLPQQQQLRKRSYRHGRAMRSIADVNPSKLPGAVCHLAHGRKGSND